MIGDGNKSSLNCRHTSEVFIVLEVSASCNSLTFIVYSLFIHFDGGGEKKKRENGGYKDRFSLEFFKEILVYCHFSN